ELPAIESFNSQPLFTRTVRRGHSLDTDCGNTLAKCSQMRDPQYPRSVQRIPTALARYVIFTGISFPPLSSYFSARSPHQSFKNLSTALLPIPHFPNSTPSNTSVSQESSLIKNSTRYECYLRRAEQYPVRWIADRHSATHRGFWAPSFSY